MKPKRPIDPIVTEALSAAGGATPMARELNITPQAVSQWKRVPIEHVSAVSRLTGIPRERLRPDVFEEVA